MELVLVYHGCCNLVIMEVLMIIFLNVPLKEN